ncbi:MAG: BrnA antitoxin family protein [Acidobacteriota bacterium]|nr:BrnA antitoxin family protein [Acidobacteriota bacterium]
MSIKNKPIDPLPDSFASEVEAGEFWDSHSTMDYAEYLEPTNDVIKIKKRVFEVQVEEDVFQRLQQEANSKHKTIPKVVDQILRETLPVT